jgi:hypothetical protein
MNSLLSVNFGKSEPIQSLSIYQISYLKEQAEQDNLAFDESVKGFLRQWIEQGTETQTDHSLADESDVNEFIETGALRSFFKHHDDALERLLGQDEIARHLLRPSSQVFFEVDAYEPLLSRFERRIYNLAAHREHREVPFRYSPMSRQGDYGDSVNLADLPPHEFREDIGCYFGTRRSDTTTLNLLARQLRREAVFSTILPIHVVTEGYMEDSLRVIRTTTEQLQQEGEHGLHCFVVQRRHAADDRHLGAALLLMDAQHPELPQRVIFCDTLNPSGIPPWWHKFKRYVDTVFPQPEGCAPASDRLEDGGVNLQRLHDGVPVRHQDIDCAFYSVTMAQALIQLAKQSPELIISGSIQEVVSQMTERMPEYFVQANVVRAPEVVREVNVVRRWQAGQEALTDLFQTCHAEMASIVPTIPEPTGLAWESTEPPTSDLDLSVAA